jgi:predicted transcriptional regulator
MAKNIYRTDKWTRIEGTVKTGKTIAAGDIVKLDGTNGYEPVENNERSGASGVAIEGATEGKKFLLSTQNDIQVVLTGTLAAGNQAYPSGAQAVDGGTQSDVSIGVSEGLYPGDATKCIVRLQTVGARTVKA